MAVNRFNMQGSFCLSQRWQSHTLVELEEEMEKYKRTYPPMGYSTRFSKPYYDHDEARWNTIMQRDRSCN